MTHVQASAMMDDDSKGDPGSGSSGRMPAAVLDVSRKGMNALAVSPDGSMLATAARDGCVRIHDLTTSAMLAAFRVQSPTAVLLRSTFSHLISSHLTKNTGVKLPQVFMAVRVLQSCLLKGSKKPFSTMQSRLALHGTSIYCDAATSVVIV